MILTDVIRELKLEKYEAVLRMEWNAGGERYLPEMLSFLSETAVKDACVRLQYPEDYIERILTARRLVAGNTALQALMWQAHYCLFAMRDYPLERLQDWPSLSALRPAMNEAAGAFYLLILISGLPHLLKRMEQAGRERGIPEGVIAATIADMAHDLKGYYRNRGGFPPKSLGFRLGVNFGGEYFCLGRLAFHLTRFPGNIRVFRHVRNGQVQALAEDGTRFLGNGQMDGPERKNKPAGGWIASLRQEARTICGWPVGPGGRALSEPITLARDEWPPVLAPGDCVLDIHIPSGGPMTFEACGESMRLAAEFFARHFPERAPKAFCCESWLLDPQLLDLVPAQSNIARFLNEFYIFPAIPDDAHLRLNIFGLTALDANGDLPGDTSLQRAALKRMRAGDPLNTSGGGGVILRDDLHWGARVYRR